MKHLITLSGKINSGKDTVADMLEYILCSLKEGKTLNKITYDNYNLYYYKGIKLVKNIGCKRISFADNLKKVLSVIFNIDIQYFNSREYKDLYLYIPFQNKFIFDDKIDKINNTYCSHKLSYIDDNDYFRIEPGILRYTYLRELMQKFAEHTKLLFGKDIWAESLVKHIVTLAGIYENIIISDLRFINEYNCIDAFEPITIYINRPNNPISTRHISETDICNSGFKFDYLINNDGNIEDLFNKVKDIVKEIYK